MIDVLKNRTFRHLFSAQVVALVGTGLTTVALALLAYDLAGAEAGAVLGTALAIKMGVYILLAPLSGALVPDRLRKRALVALDLVRAAIALMLPFVSEIWQVYLLIAVLQSASACFTPLFQSIIPVVLRDERDYTKALSLSRMAYDTESLLSPVLAAALLTVISYHTLFAGTSVGFVASAVLVLTSALPKVAKSERAVGPLQKALRGMRIYVRTPRLRGLLALNLCAAAGGAMVFVNTVVVVRQTLGSGEREVAAVLAAFGLGSMGTALAMPRLLDRISDRTLMLSSALLMLATLVLTSLLWFLLGRSLSWPLVVVAWALMGIAYAGLVTPGGRLLRRSANEDDMPFLFAAQFSLSHMCWLIAYPLAGWVGATWGLGSALISLATLAATACAAGIRLWPAVDDVSLSHTHSDLQADHPHLAEHARADGSKHSHPYVIDELHTRWPR